VTDLQRSSRYFIDVLGFSEDPIVSPGWSFLSKDQFHLMLGECPDEVPASATGNHSWFIHLLIDDVDAYYAEVKSRGAVILSSPADRAYGLREFILGTPEGHRLVVGQPLDRAGEA
jgi:predicted enzyme related to lactoylglutathione lyase